MVIEKKVIKHPIEIGFKILAFMQQWKILLREEHQMKIGHALDQLQRKAQEVTLHQKTSTEAGE